LSGAVQLQTPATISVPPNGAAQFDVHLKIDPTKLPTWNLNGGQLGGTGSLLQGVEVDGYLRITDGTDHIHLAWQVLPHKAAGVVAQITKATPKGGVLVLDNRQGAADGGVEIFSLTGQSGEIKKKFLPGPGAGFALIDIRSVGVRLIDL